jgi:hypothetical protein
VRSTRRAVPAKGACHLFPSEKKTLEFAREALEAIRGSKGMLVQAYLLEYLSDDEEKHNRLLERLADIQRGMYPYA